MLNYIIYTCLICGCFCSSVVVNYATSTKEEDMKTTAKWFKRMLFFAVVGIICVYLKKL